MRDDQESVTALFSRKRKNRESRIKMTEKYNAPTHIKVRGARVHNLKNVNVDVPLNQIGRHCRGFRFREIFPGSGSFVCRRFKAVS